MIKSARLMKEFGFGDEGSVTFSVDPDMYTKLDIRKAKKGEENSFDLEKIYRYQLEKDVKKLVVKKGSYQHRNDLYLKFRHADPFYSEIAKPHALGADGNFNETAKVVADYDWRISTKPYGEHAHKRYLKYVENLPKGPTAHEVQDRQQRRQDRDLWYKVV
jgi:hypothetical protein